MIEELGLLCGESVLEGPAPKSVTASSPILIEAMAVMTSKRTGYCLCRVHMYCTVAMTVVVRTGVRFRVGVKQTDKQPCDWPVNTQAFACVCDQANYRWRGEDGWLLDQL